MSTDTYIPPGRHGRGCTGPVLLRILLALTVIALGLLVGLQRSLISEHVDDRVKTTSWTEDGPAFKVLVMRDGQELTVDDGLLDRMGGTKAVEGKRLRTDAFSTTAHLNSKLIPLRWSNTATRTVLTLAALIIIGAWRARRSRRVGTQPRSSRARNRLTKSFTISSHT